MRNTIILILAALLSSVSAPAADRTVIGGLVPVENLDITRNNSRLYMTMDFDLSELRLRSDEDITLTPRGSTTPSSECASPKGAASGAKNAAAR